MAEICFSFCAAQAAQAIQTELQVAHPNAPAAHCGGPSGAVVHIPAALWVRPLVPEIVLGMGGRLVICQVVPGQPGCVPDGPDDLPMQPRSRHRAAARRRPAAVQQGSGSMSGSASTR